MKKIYSIIFNAIIIGRLNNWRKVLQNIVLKDCEKFMQMFIETPVDSDE